MLYLAYVETLAAKAPSKLVQTLATDASFHSTNKEQLPVALKRARLHEPVFVK